MPTDSKIADVLDLEKIERLRHRLKMSQQQAAEAAKLSGRQQWNAIVNDRQGGMTLRTLANIAKALKVSPRDLLKRK